MALQSPRVSLVHREFEGGDAKLNRRHKIGAQIHLERNAVVAAARATEHQTTTTTRCAGPSRNAIYQEIRSSTWA